MKREARVGQEGRKPRTEMKLTGSPPIPRPRWDLSRTNSEQLPRCVLEPIGKCRKGPQMAAVRPMSAPEGSCRCVCARHGLVLRVLLIVFRFQQLLARIRSQVIDPQSVGGGINDVTRAFLLPRWHLPCPASFLGDWCGARASQ